MLLQSVKQNNIFSKTYNLTLITSEIDYNADYKNLLLIKVVHLNSSKQKSMSQNVTCFNKRDFVLIVYSQTQICAAPGKP